MKNTNRVSIASARAANVDNGKAETADQRVGRLVGLAIKASHESFATIADGAAAAVWFAIEHGRCDYMNKLFNGMNPKDSLAFRTYYVVNVCDTFGAGGERNEDGTWAKRPVQFFQYTANPKIDGKATDTHFRIAKSEKPEVALLIKQGMANARSKSEGEFREVEWVSPEQARTSQVYTPVKALNSLKSTFMAIAKNLPKSGMSAAELLRMVNASPLDVGNRTAIGDVANAAIAPKVTETKGDEKEMTEEDAARLNPVARGTGIQEGARA